MKAVAAAIAGALGLFLVLPIWFYLLHQILVRVNASELMMFLFWVYLPATWIAALIGNFLRKAAQD